MTPQLGFQQTQTAVILKSVPQRLEPDAGHHGAVCAGIDQETVTGGETPVCIGDPIGIDGGLAELAAPEIIAPMEESPDMLHIQQRTDDAPSPGGHG